MPTSFVPPVPPISTDGTDSHPTDLIDHRTSLVLCAISIASYLLTFALNVLLARNLSSAEFDDYNVAMAIVLTLSTVATLGFEKLALYQLPVYRERQDWDHARGFLRASRLSIVFASVLLAAMATFVVKNVLAALGNSLNVGVLLVIISLPVVAQSLFLIDVLTAYRRQILASAIYRLMIPACLLALNWGLIMSCESYTAIQAGSAFGAIWLFALIVLAKLFRRSRPAETMTATPRTLWWNWLKSSVPLFLFSLLLTAQGQSGVLVLEILYPPDPIVSEYAMAYSIGTFVLLLSTATNRYYLPFLAVHLERRDAKTFHHDLQMRRLWIGLMVLTFTITISLFGETLLSFFGLAYVHIFPALMMIVIGTAVAVLFAPAPYILQYLGYNRTVVLVSFASLVATLVGSVYFGSRYGGIGVAASFAGPLAAQFLSLKIIMHAVVHRYFADERIEANPSESG